MLRDFLRKEIFAISFEFMCLSLDEALNDKLFEGLSQNIELSFLMFYSIYITEKLMDEASIQKMHDSVFHATDIDIDRHPLFHFAYFKHPGLVLRIKKPEIVPT